MPTIANGVKYGSWEKLWYILLKKHKPSLDMSSVQLDGTNTPAKRGGEAVDYQGRKHSGLVMLILSNSKSMPFAYSDPISANHHDVFNRTLYFLIVTSLEQSNIKSQRTVPEC